MTKEQVLEKLRIYIAITYKTQKAYAEHKGMLPTNVSTVMRGKVSIPDHMLEDIGIKREVVKKEIYTQA